MYKSNAEMEKAVKRLTLIFVLVLGGGICSVRSSMLSDTNLDLSRDLLSDKPHEHIEIKSDHDDKTLRTTPPSIMKNDKLFTDNYNHPYKDFDINEIFESFFKPFQTLFEPNKKPKVKTVVSLTEVVGPKHQMMPPFHQDPISSQFGVKELGFMDDPFNIDLGRMLPGFMPKISKVDFIWPMKHNHDKHFDFPNISDVDALTGRRHHIKRDMPIFPKLDGFDEKLHTGPSLFIKGTGGETPLVSLGEINLDEGANNNDESKEKLCSLVKALPYLEGAIGGVMFVMLILVIASWRIRKPNGIWARVPFIDKTDYVEKV